MADRCELTELLPDQCGCRAHRDSPPLYDPPAAPSARRAGVVKRKRALLRLHCLVDAHGRPVRCRLSQPPKVCFESQAAADAFAAAMVRAGIAELVNASYPCRYRGEVQHWHTTSRRTRELAPPRPALPRDRVVD